MNTLSDKRKQDLSLTLFYASFLFLWVSVFPPAGRAGEGWLSARQQEKVYYVQQIFLIAGMLACAARCQFLSGRRKHLVLALFVFAVFLPGVAVLLFADSGTPFYLAVSFAVMLCLGELCGEVYHRMSRETACGTDTAGCMGVGSAAAIALQYLLQIRWGQTPVLPVLMLAAVLMLAYRLLTQEEVSPEKDTPASGPVQPSRLLTTSLITVLFLLFLCFYNAYLHHRTVQPDSSATGAYTWPRLITILCYLLFAVIGDRKQGRLVPLAALLITLAATLNSVLTGSRGAYWLNMCLFYSAAAATICYYTLRFWQLAPGTKCPALWASMGRIIDCAMVLVTGSLRLDTLPAAGILGLDLAGVALIILMMAVSGDFNLTEAEVPEVQSLCSPEETLARMRERYNLTAREAEVLRELVQTEDKQTVVSKRLSIQVKTLQDYVTRLYRKTGASTRAGLTDLYYETREQR